MQTYVYYMNYSDDALVIRVLVTAVWILSTLHFSFMCHFLYYYLVTNYGIPTSLLYMVWSLPASVLVHVTVAIVVQCFFMRQIHYLCRPQVRWWVAAPIILSLLAETGFGMAAIIMFVNNKTSLSIQISFYTGTPGLAVVILAEILITVSLCTLFYDNGSSSVFPRMKCLLNTLIIYAVNRCLLTLLVAIAELVMDVNQLDTWTIALDFIGQGLYPNSLLASLNARQHLRERASSNGLDSRISIVDFAKLSKLQGHVENSEGGTGRFGV
ncbi:hypothetical protein EDD16DRAFT_117420 [Pisolithus croceorrhizus]|nr:hypothetical protein EDD16DRAFT_117420 [Pisolithus croceorrhizus]